MKACLFGVGLGLAAAGLGYLVYGWLLVWPLWVVFLAGLVLGAFVAGAVALWVLSGCIPECP